MPVLPYVPNGAQLVVRTFQSSQEQLHTLHVLGPSGFNGGDLDELCEVAAEAWGTAIMPFASFKCVLTDAFARGIRGEGDALGQYTLTSPVEGASTNESERPQEATCIKLSTGLSGAGFRGRMFVAGLPGNQVDEGLINTTFRNNLANGLNVWLSQIRGVTAFEPVIISYYRERVLRAVPVATPIQGTQSVTRYPSVLASRTPGSGN